MNLIAGLIMFFLAWAGFVGYVMNVITMFHATELSVVLAIRIFGIVLFPIGCVAGYF